ncbi:MULTISPECIES: DMT family transporter [unclassified Halomonas]|uniref:DMT family transporter n=1 Tax=unclassified Halomonas TaxID=2609666 RepID=UPI0007F0E256|nr:MULTISPECIES: DMT family transporter [unclassified Halomonas]SBR50859.1 EamA-like transporter family protein [Halomonas sp. HL-93]SNY97073.1 EamA-like transporter family protein [Halomonas sp. hl-4]
MKATPEHEDNILQGISLIVGAVFLLALTDALVKYLSASMSLWQLYVIASTLSLPILLGLLIGHSGARPNVKSPRWVAIRSLLLLLMWIAYYTALPLIPLSVAAVAIYTTPLFIAVLAAFGAGEYLSRLAWLGIFCGFLGVVVVLRPGDDTFTPATLLPMLAAIFYALAMLVTRHHCQTEHPFILTLGLNLAFLTAGSVFSVLVAINSTASLAERAPFLFTGWQPLDATTLAIIGAYALLLITVNTGVARAYQIAPSALIGTFDYAYLIFASLWGYLLFSEVPDAMTWLGMGMILMSGLMVLRQRHT